MSAGAPEKPLAPCFPYPGGKAKMRAALIPLFPEHAVYVEPFGGAAAVLFGKPRSKVEVLNDRDEDIVTFFRYARLHADALLAEIDAVVAARREFEFMRDGGQPDTELARALAFFFRQMVSFGGCATSFSVRRARAPHWGGDFIRARILAARERMRRVTVECRDALDVIAFYDGPETFFFVDPPYVRANPGRYAAFSPADMSRLRDALARCRGQWLLTCDDSPECREIFAGFRSETLGNTYTLARAAPREVSELVVFSANFRPKNEARFPVPGRQVEAA